MDVYLIPGIIFFVFLVVWFVTITVVTTRYYRKKRRIQEWRDERSGNRWVAERNGKP